MSNYAENKKALDKIRDEYGCKGEVIFRTAIQYVVEYGQIMFEDEEWVKSQLERVDCKHDTAEAEGKELWIGRGLEKACIECAAEIAKVKAYDLLVYIQKELYLSNEGGLDYGRAIELLHSCMNWFIDYDCCTNKEMLKKFDDLGFYDNELETLGLDWLFEEEEN